MHLPIMAWPRTSIAVVRRQHPLLQVVMWSALGVVALAAIASAARVLRQPHYPVSGTVLVDGQPVEGAVVTLYPLEPSSWAYVAPSAKTQADGRFEIKTFGLRSGAATGEYAATVVWTPPVVEGEDIAAARNVIPNRFARPETTPLRAGVDEGSNRIEPFQITGGCRDVLGSRFTHASLTTNRLNQVSGDPQK